MLAPGSQVKTASGIWRANAEAGFACVERKSGREEPLGIQIIAPPLGYADQLIRIGEHSWVRSSQLMLLRGWRVKALFGVDLAVASVASLVKSLKFETRCSMTCGEGLVNLVSDEQDFVSCEGFWIATSPSHKPTLKCEPSLPDLSVELLVLDADVSFRRSLIASIA